jgi:hypothetical protein
MTRQKAPKVLRGRRLKVHRDVDVSHAKASDDAAFVWECIVGGGEGEVDNGFKTGLTNLAKLSLGRLAGSSQFGTQGTEVVNVG